MAELAHLSALLLDTKLAALRASAKARQESEDRLARLNVPDLPRDALPGMGAELILLSYNRWADARRAEINQTLARQSVALMEAQADARDAFGRLHAINKLKGRA